MTEVRARLEYIFEEREDGDRWSGSLRRALWVVRMRFFPGLGEDCASMHRVGVGLSVENDFEGPASLISCSHIHCKTRP